MKFCTKYILILVFSLILLTGCDPTYTKHTGIVIERIFVPYNHYQNEHFVLIIRENGQIRKYDYVDLDTYGNAKVGESITFSLKD